MGWLLSVIHDWWSINAWLLLMPRSSYREPISTHPPAVRRRLREHNDDSTASDVINRMPMMNRTRAPTDRPAFRVCAVVTNPSLVSVHPTRCKKVRNWRNKRSWRKRSSGSNARIEAMHAFVAYVAWVAMNGKQAWLPLWSRTITNTVECIMFILVLDLSSEWY